MSTTQQISLEQAIAAVRARRAPITTETAGYIALAIADGLLTSPAVPTESGVFLSLEGDVTVLGAQRSDDPNAPERTIRSIFQRLLSVAAGSSPALTACARRPHLSSLPGLVAELEAALIPVNRSAARRSISRLARETSKVLESLPTSAASPSSRPLAASNPSPAESASSRRDPASRSAQASSRPLASQPEPPPTIDKASLNDMASAIADAACEGNLEIEESETLPLAAIAVDTDRTAIDAPVAESIATERSDDASTLLEDAHVETLAPVVVVDLAVSEVPVEQRPKASEVADASHDHEPDDAMDADELSELMRGLGAIAQPESKVECTKHEEDLAGGQEAAEVAQEAIASSEPEPVPASSEPEPVPALSEPEPVRPPTEGLDNAEPSSPSSASLGDRSPTQAASNASTSATSKIAVRGVDELLAGFANTTERSAKDLSGELKQLVGLEPTPPPPTVVARDHQEDDLDDGPLEGADEGAVVPTSSKRVSSGQYARPRAPKTSMSITTILLVLGVATILGLYFFYPSFFTGRP